MRPLLLLLALCAAAPAVAQQPDSETATAEATWPERPTDRQLEDLASAKGLLAADPAEALAQAQSVVDDLARETLHADALALQGDALKALGFPHAALDAWARSLETDPRALAPRLADVFEVAEAVNDRRRVEDAIVALQSTEPRAHLYSARSLLRSGQSEAAAARARMVESRSQHFPAAKLVEGAARSQTRDHQGALAAFAIAEARGTDPSIDWQRAIQVNLARTYFALGNQPKALTYYANVDRGAPNWTQVHFETAWSHFRMGDMAGTLAALHSIQSPFFDDGYWAESELLAAYALFYMCKFPAARERIEAFEVRWKPVRAALDGATDVSTAEAWEDLRRMVGGESPRRLPAPVLDRYTWDVRAARAMALVDALDAEAIALDAASRSRAATAVRARRASVIDEEGQRILAHASAIRAELSSMLQDVEITKLDLLDLEKRLYESAAVSGELGMGNPLGDIRTIRREADARVWPFQGEYWADEIGYFRVTARSDCPANLQIGGR